MYAFQMAIARQMEWAEEEMRENGCMVSCVREVYKTRVTMIDHPAQKMRASLNPSV